MSKESWRLIALKRAAEGTDGFSSLQKACSDQLKEDYGRYIARTKVKIDELSESPKQWWKLSSSLLLKSRSSNGIPPLQGADGEWARLPKEKTDLLAKRFASKFTLPDIVQNEYSDIGPKSSCEHSGFFPNRARLVMKLLTNVKNDSATGPDLLSTRILKQFAHY